MSKLTVFAPIALAVALAPACGNDPPATSPDAPPPPPADAAPPTPDSGPTTDGPAAACDPFACKGGAHCMGMECVCPEPFVSSTLEYTGLINNFFPQGDN